MKEALNKFQDKLLNFGGRLGQQKHLSSISTGIMATLPLTIIAAVINIIFVPPINESMLQGSNVFISFLRVWYEFSQTHMQAIMIPINMTNGLISVGAVFAISHTLAKKYDLSTLSTSLTAVIMFLIVAAPTQAMVLASSLTSTTDITQLSSFNAIPQSYLGAEGLFLGIIISILSVEITRFCRDKKLTIRLPESVPSMVADSFSSIIPAIINVTIIYGLNLILVSIFNKPVTELLVSFLTPAINVVNTPLMIIALATFGQVLWIMGVHGNSIALPFVLPLIIPATIRNAQLVALGQTPVFDPSFLWMFCILGGSGCTIGLALLMARSKSEQLKAVGRLSVVPGIMGINEPIIFGAPIVYNPILAIPFILAPIACMLLAWLLYSIGWMSPMYLSVPTSLPLGLREFLGSMDWRAGVLTWIAFIPLSMLIYYPFFKTFERKLLEEQNGEEKSSI